MKEWQLFAVIGVLSVVVVDIIIFNDGLWTFQIVHYIVEIVERVG